MFKTIRRLLLATALIMPVAATTATLAKEAEDKDFQSASTFAGAYLAGAAALQDFDFDAAAYYYGEALNYDPENADLQRELMIAYINISQFEKAVPLAEKLKGADSIERISQLVLGIDALNRDQFDAVTQLLDFSQKNDLERLLTGIISGWAQMGAGNIDQALSIVDELEGPEWFALFKAYHGALMADMAGRNDDAQARYEDALNDAAGGNAAPLTYLRLSETFAGFMIKQGKLDEARDAIKRGLGIAPNNPSLVQLDETLSAQSTTLAIDSPSDGAAEILLNLGSAINREGAETFATIYLELSLAARNGEAQALYELGAIAERLNLTEKAVSLYEKVPADSPLSRPAALQQGLALSALDRNDEAIETLQALVDASPDDYAGYMALGGVLAFERRFDEAVTLYTAAFENLDNEDPRFWPLHYRLGIAYERTKQWPKAEEKFKYALTLSPDQPDILNYLGYSWIDMNINLGEGLEMIQKAVDMRPNDGYIIDSLGWAQYRLGEFEQAVLSLERATDLRPRDPTINDHLGDAYWRVGRKLEAAFQWSQVLEMEESPETDKAMVQAKIDAANNGKTPLIAESSVDKKNGDAQATNDDG